MDNPLDQIAAPPPSFSETQACELLSRHYGIRAAATPLVSERDQNFLMTAAGEPVGILKIANSVEPPHVTHFQIDALTHVEAVDDALDCVPRILPTTTGEDSFTTTSGNGTHIVRLVSYLRGVPAGDGDSGTWPFAASLGETLARLNRALRDFQHAGQAQILLWDMQRAPALRDLLVHVDVTETRALLERTLDEFERRALPAFESLPRQVIHNDANPANVLLAEGETSRVSGLIDFGDMLFAPRIVELGVAGAYLRVLDGNPLEAVCRLLAGYHRAFPLERDEIEILPALLRTRLATTLLILEWRRSLRGAEDDYLRAAQVTERSALSFLQRLDALPDAEARQILAEAP